MAQDTGIDFRLQWGGVYLIEKSYNFGKNYSFYECAMNGHITTLEQL